MEFIEEVNQNLSDKALSHDKNVDFYEVIAAKNLESSNPKDRLCLYLNDITNYSWDTKEYNSFVRLRRDHLEKLGL